MVCSFVLSYLFFCLFLFVRQRHLIYRPRPELSLQPSSPDFELAYQDVWIPIENTSEQLHGWWLPAVPGEQVTILPDEPRQVLSSPKTMLYFCGVGRNMWDYNYLSRVAAFRQLGFSVVVFDYRGYGKSQGSFPTEEQLYDDSQAAWIFVRDELSIPAEDVVIYGESLGGAIALNLAIQQPDAAGLIMQSSFTTMADAVKHKPIASIIPVDLILTEDFDSIGKISTLEMPVLFLHGSDDAVVPVSMSDELYQAAPEPKQRLIIPGAEHVSIYTPGEGSYLKAVNAFISTL